MIKDKKLQVAEIVSGEHYENCTFLATPEKFKVSDVSFNDCTFEQTDLSSGEWLDCTFERMNFANYHFEKSLFYRDHFNTCNLLGTDFSDNNWKDSSFDDCRVDYANFSESKFTKCTAQASSFKETYFRYVEFKSGFVTKDCDFDAASFIGSKLKKVDLSKSEFEVLEVLPEDLDGLIINQFQASALVGVLGVVVK
ncbi:Quinolone resistance protein [Pediococcus damnosus]|uniref:Quinolone resistance protein n=1 Tax=Pediococcus damnosus TaxID=51663 RepID=A0ABN4N916_9LACO|nr:pentapeptide repeat-containing protein [Pediococcus damnosus]AMV67017.1 Quinolone resistance protein [Pediococcus damnosus]